MGWGDPFFRIFDSPLAGAGYASILKTNTLMHTKYRDDVVVSEYGFLPDGLGHHRKQESEVVRRG